MSLLSNLAKKNLKLNKKRSIGTVVGIILSVALICAVAGMFECFHETLVENSINEKGYYHYDLPELDEQTYEELKSNRAIKNLMNTYEIGTSFISNKNESNPYITIRSTDYLEDFKYKVIEGRLPKDNTELIITQRMAYDGDLNVGDSIELDVGTRMTNDGYKLHTSNPYHDEIEERIDNPIHKTYKIVGIFTRYGYSYAHAGITTKETSSVINAYVALKDPKDRTFVEGLYESKKFARPGEPQNGLFTINTNHELLRWEIFAFSDSTITVLYAVVSIVIGIIIFTSVFCIRNSFAISTTEKLKMFGMLSSIGATKKQIKKTVLIEAFILGLIAIPFGIVSGILADFILVKVVNVILKDHLFNNIDGIVFQISYISIVLAILLGFITIYLSAVSSARKASRVSPIDNMRSSKDIMLNSKNLRTPKIISCVFKTGGVLSYKNLKRSKKKYRTTVISLAVSVFIFIAMNSFIKDAFDITGRYYKDYDYNVVVSNTSELSLQDIEEIVSLDNIENFHILYEVDHSDNKNDYVNIFDMNKINGIDDVKDSAICTSYDKATNECVGEFYYSIDIKALDDESFKKYVKKLGLNYDAIKETGILIDTSTFYVDNKSVEARRYTYKVGEILKGTFHESDFEIKIGEITSTKPYGLENYSYSGGFLIVDKDYFKDIDFAPMLITINSSDSAKLASELDSLKKNLSVSDIEETKRAERAISIVVSIFLYGFIAVITLIGVTNIFNTITSNMELRQKEFAMLKSIGMTKKEFTRMINLETFFYSSKSLIYGIILGTIASYMIHNAFDMKTKTVFKLPLTPIIISIIFVFILVYFIMRFSIAKINKQNTIETIRKDNI